MTEAAVLYEEDYYAWAKAQAEALRTLARQRSTVPLDLEHLSEEVSDLGRAERNACLRQIERLIEHLLKLQYSSRRRPCRRWIASIDDARRALEKHLTPTLEAELRTLLPDLYPHERRRTARKLRLYNDPRATDTFPKEWSLRSRAIS